MAAALPSFLNVPLPSVPTRQPPSNAKGKLPAASPPPAEDGGGPAPPMFKMTMSASHWALIQKTAAAAVKTGRRDHGMSIDFDAQGKGLLRLDASTSLALGVPKKAHTDRHEDVFRVSLASAATYALQHHNARSSAPPPRLQGLYGIPKGTPTFKLEPVPAPVAALPPTREQEMGSKLREMKEQEEQRKKEHAIKRLEMHEDPMLKSKRRHLVGNGKVMPVSRNASSKSSPSPPKPTLLAPKLAKPPRTSSRPGTPMLGSTPGTPRLGPHQGGRSSDEASKAASSSGSSDEALALSEAVKPAAAPASGLSEPLVAALALPRAKALLRSETSSSSGSDVPLAAGSTPPKKGVGVGGGVLVKSKATLKKEEQDRAKAKKAEAKQPATVSESEPAKAKAPKKGKVFKSAEEIDSDDDEDAEGDPEPVPPPAPATTPRETAPPVNIKKARPPPTAAPMAVIKRARPPAPVPAKKASSMTRTSSSSASESAPVDKPVKPLPTKKQSPGAPPKASPKPAVAASPPPKTAGLKRSPAATDEASASDSKVVKRQRVVMSPLNDEEEEGQIKEDRPEPGPGSKLEQPKPRRKKQQPIDANTKVEASEALRIIKKRKQLDEQASDRSKKAKVDGSGPSKASPGPGAASPPEASNAVPSADVPASKPASPWTVQLPKFKRVSGASATSAAPSRSLSQSSTPGPPPASHSRAPAHTSPRDDRSPPPLRGRAATDRYSPYLGRDRAWDRDRDRHHSRAGPSDSRSPPQAAPAASWSHSPVDSASAMAPLPATRHHPANALGLFALHASRGSMPLLKPDDDAAEVAPCAVPAAAAGFSPPTYDPAKVSSGMEAIRAAMLARADRRRAGELLAPAGHGHGHGHGHAPPRPALAT